MQYGWSDETKTSGHEVVKPRTKMKRKKENIPAKNIFGKREKCTSPKTSDRDIFKAGGCYVI